MTYLARHIVPAALALLPPKMDSPEARAMLFAIALQESKCCHRRQIRGPARSFWQFEVTGVRGVLAHHASKPYAADVLAALSYPVTDDATVPYIAMEHNDVLAAAFARLLLYTLPDPLPASDNAVAGWTQYLDAWRPGKPHPETWPDHFAKAWECIDGLS